MARPSEGMRHLDCLSGSAEAKARFAVIFATLSGEKSVSEACAVLGICEARFHAMRKEFLAESLSLLEKRAAGRKPSSVPEPSELSRLRDENENLRLALEAAQIKTEIALTMPGLLKAPSPVKKKRCGRNKRRFSR